MAALHVLRSSFRFTSPHIFWQHSLMRVRAIIRPAAIVMGKVGRAQLPERERASLDLPARIPAINCDRGSDICSLAILFAANRTIRFIRTGERAGTSDSYASP